jgi:hypothetical protein
VKTDIGAKGKGRRAKRSGRLFVVLVLLLELVLDQIGWEEVFRGRGTEN